MGLPKLKTTEEQRTANYIALMVDDIMRGDEVEVCGKKISLDLISEAICDNRGLIASLDNAIALCCAGVVCDGGLRIQALYKQVAESMVSKAIYKEAEL